MATTRRPIRWTMTSSYACQKCKQPLQLDASLADLTPSSYDLLASTLASFPSRPQQPELGRISTPSDPKDVRRRSLLQAGNLASTPDSTIPQLHRPIPSLPDASFVYLQDSVVQKIPSSGVPQRSGNVIASPQISNDSSSKTQSTPVSPPTSPLSHKLKSTNKLFSLLSTKTDIEHPLCTECTDSLLKNLTEQLKDTMRERDGYIAFEKELKKERHRDEEPIEEIERRIERLKEEEKLAIEDLKEAQQEKELLEDELRTLELEEKELEEEESE